MRRDFVTPSTAKCVFSFVERKKKEKKKFSFERMRRYGVAAVDWCTGKELKLS